nr:hypothetical protein [Angustibacter aerolatus]
MALSAVAVAFAVAVAGAGDVGVGSVPGVVPPRCRAGRACSA